jgi:hypothetical protein
MTFAQPDLFGEPQGDLFASSTAPTRETWQPDPVKVRRRLERILAEMRANETMHWDWAMKPLYAKIFPDMAHLLPQEEGDAFIAQFDAEWARLMHDHG